MKRWDKNKHDDVEDPLVDAFVSDLVAVYRKHGMSLGHEDNHGAFIIEKLDETNVRWVQDAMIDFWQDHKK